jgi:hypothetical protein
LKVKDDRVTPFDGAVKVSMAAAWLVGSQVWLTVG